MEFFKKFDVENKWVDWVMCVNTIHYTINVNGKKCRHGGSYKRLVTREFTL